jgi:hypothetical protein
MVNYNAKILMEIKAITPCYLSNEIPRQLMEDLGLSLCSRKPNP